MDQNKMRVIVKKLLTPLKRKDLCWEVDIAKDLEQYRQCISQTDFSYNRTLPDDVADVNLPSTSKTNPGTFGCSFVEAGAIIENCCETYGSKVDDLIKESYALNTSLFEKVKILNRTKTKTQPLQAKEMRSSVIRKTEPSVENKPSKHKRKQQVHEIIQESRNNELCPLEAFEALEAVERFDQKLSEELASSQCFDTVLYEQSLERITAFKEVNNNLENHLVRQKHGKASYCRYDFTFNTNMIHDLCTNIGKPDVLIGNRTPQSERSVSERVANECPEGGCMMTHNDEIYEGFGEPTDILSSGREVTNAHSDFDKGDSGINCSYISETGCTEFSDSAFQTTGEEVRKISEHLSSESATINATSTDFSPLVDQSNVDVDCSNNVDVNIVSNDLSSQHLEEICADITNIVDTNIRNNGLSSEEHMEENCVDFTTNDISNENLDENCDVCPGNGGSVPLLLNNISELPAVICSNNADTNNVITDCTSKKNTEKKCKPIIDLEGLHNINESIMDSLRYIPQSDFDFFATPIVQNMINEKMKMYKMDEQNNVFKLPIKLFESRAIFRLPAPINKLKRKTSAISKDIIPTKCLKENEQHLNVQNWIENNSVIMDRGSTTINLGNLQGTPSAWDNLSRPCSVILTKRISEFPDLGYVTDTTRRESTPPCEPLSQLSSLTTQTTVTDLGYETGENSALELTQTTIDTSLINDSLQIDNAEASQYIESGYTDSQEMEIDKNIDPGPSLFDITESVECAEYDKIFQPSEFEENLVLKYKIDDCDIVKRVMKFHKEFEPKLKIAEERSHFDIKDYEQDALNCFGNQQEIRMKDVLKNKSRGDKGRYLMALLQLANNKNINIHQPEIMGNTCCTSTVKLTLRSSLRYDPRESYLEQNKTSNKRTVAAAPKASIVSSTPYKSRNIVNKNSACDNLYLNT